VLRFDPLPSEVELWRSENVVGSKYSSGDPDLVEVGEVKPLFNTSVLSSLSDSRAVQCLAYWDSSPGFCW
jgi:hypothetical protein